VAEKKVQDKKKQHFVAQFHLRNFSASADQKWVSLFVLDSERHVPMAAVKDQAWETYFYGRDGLEDKLAMLEGLAAPVIKKAIEQDILPEPNSREHVALLVYVLFQGARTPVQAAQVNEQAEKLVKAVAADFDDLKDRANQNDITIPNAPLMSLLTAQKLVPFAQDLSYKLLKNKTPRLFLLGDNPTVKYNQFLETRTTHGSITGIGCRGLQIFLPLSPRNLVVFYDKDVYRVGGRRWMQTCVYIECERDIAALNILQAARADEVLFFSPDTRFEHVQDALENARPHRRSESVSTVERFALTIGGKTGQALRWFKLDLRIGLKLDFCGILPSAAGPKLDPNVEQLRQPERVRRFQEAHLSGTSVDARQFVESFLRR
jgi:hypothetical protein